MDERELDALTREVLDLKAHAAHCADTLADLGDRFRRVKEALPYGGWTAWLARVGVDRKTAWNYMRLAALRAQEPDRYAGLVREGLRVAYSWNGSTTSAAPKPRGCPPIRAATRADFADAVVRRMDELTAETARIWEGTGVLTPEGKRRALDAAERLRSALLKWPAFAAGTGA